MELPEMFILAQQMEKELRGKRISDIEVKNPKCLNVSYEEFKKTVKEKQVFSVEARGKWLFISLDTHMLLFNPGMGADILYFTNSPPEKYQIRINLKDKTGVTIRVWWFCYLHLVSRENLQTHNLTFSLGMTPLDESFTLEYFTALLSKKRGYIKPFLLDQKNVAGIGNFYIHDILFDAGVHPMRKISSLTCEEVEALYHSMQSLLLLSIELGGSRYEKDFYGNSGKFDVKKHFRVGYNSGSCPVCNTQVQKIRTGSTSSYVCPTCQPASRTSRVSDRKE